MSSMKSNSCPRLWGSFFSYSLLSWQCRHGAAHGTLGQSGGAAAAVRPLRGPGQPSLVRAQTACKPLAPVPIRAVPRSVVQGGWRTELGSVWAAGEGRFAAERASALPAASPQRGRKRQRGRGAAGIGHCPPTPSLRPLPLPGRRGRTRSSAAQPSSPARVPWVRFSPVPSRCLPFPPYEQAGAARRLAVTAPHTPGWTGVPTGAPAFSFPSQSQKSPALNGWVRPCCRIFLRELCTGNSLGGARKRTPAGSPAVRGCVPSFPHFPGRSSVLLGALRRHHPRPRRQGCLQAVANWWVSVKLALQFHQTRLDGVSGWARVSRWYESKAVSWEKDLERDCSLVPSTTCYPRLGPSVFPCATDAWRKHMQGGMPDSKLRTKVSAPSPRCRWYSWAFTWGEKMPFWQCDGWDAFASSCSWFLIIPLP